MLVIDDDADLEEYTETLADRIKLWTGNHAQIIVRNPDEIGRLYRAKEPILAEWERDLVVIFGSRSALRNCA